MQTKPSLLWIGDAVAHTGFSSVTHGILDNIHKYWNVNVLGVNYHGDPHSYPYSIWPAMRNGDIYGYNRVVPLIQNTNPDVICILNDPWVVMTYIQQIDQYFKAVERSGSSVKLPKIVVYTPVDALNIQERFVTPLNRANLVIAYTDFGLNEMRISGLTSEGMVIPHGNDSTVFYPMGRDKARTQLNLSDDWFIVGCVNRNQPRKRLDLFMEYFAEFAKDKPENVKVYYHGALADVGWDVVDLAKFFGVEDRLITTSDRITAGVGVSRDVLRAVYNSFDVQVSTTMGEGWGLTTMEGMSCKIPQIVPDWSALGEWTEESVLKVPCTSTSVHTGGINTVGGIADKNLFVDALHKMYWNKEYRYSLGHMGYSLVTQDKYKWSSVAREFDLAFRKTLKHG